MFYTHSILYLQCIYTQCIYILYTGYKPTDETVRALWNVLRSLNKEEKALFVQFVTGTSKVYMYIYSAQFSYVYILRLHAHTCTRSK